jgi:hypothetical protein
MYQSMVAIVCREVAFFVKPNALLFWAGGPQRGAVDKYDHRLVYGKLFEKKKIIFGSLIQSGLLA